MNEIKNPFPVSGYYGTALFCDREEETKRLVTNEKNGIITTVQWNLLKAIAKDDKVYQPSAKSFIA